MLNTVSHQDEDTARVHGVTLVVTPSDLSYMVKRAKAVCAKTGKVIMKDNIIFVKHWLKRNRIAIVETISLNEYDRTNL